MSVLIGKDFPVVGHDWLSFSGVCYYDAIVMNPPFSNGDEHLLRAWDFLHDGEIVCLLNEETIKNPFTAARKRLAALIEKHGDVEFLGDCFSNAERKTDVRVAMVYLRKTSDDDAVDLWANTTPEKAVDDDIGGDAQHAGDPRPARQHAALLRPGQRAHAQGVPAHPQGSAVPEGKRHRRAPRTTRSILALALGT